MIVNLCYITYKELHCCLVLSWPLFPWCAVCHLSHMPIFPSCEKPRLVLLVCGKVLTQSNHLWKLQERPIFRMVMSQSHCGWSDCWRLGAGRYWVNTWSQMHIVSTRIQRVDKHDYITWSQKIESNPSSRKDQDIHDPQIRFQLLLEKDHHKLFSWISQTKPPKVKTMIAMMIHEQNTIFHHEKM